jgi:hypothetical protein
VVKKISHEQSRRNAARRRRRVATRHGLAGHWSARPAPVFGSGTVSYEIGGNVDATCFGGIAAVHRLVTKLGLPDIGWLPQRGPGGDPSCDNPRRDHGRWVLQGTNQSDCQHGRHILKRRPVLVREGRSA